ncbi:hypothetical protein L195_g049693, partial [Trifolium pratense]
EYKIIMYRVDVAKLIGIHGRVDGCDFALCLTILCGTFAC